MILIDKFIKGIESYVEENPEDSFAQEVLNKVKQEKELGFTMVDFWMEGDNYKYKAHK